MPRYEERLFLESVPIRYLHTLRGCARYWEGVCFGSRSADYYHDREQCQPMKEYVHHNAFSVDSADEG